MLSGQNAALTPEPYILHINSWTGAGKQTIARILAARPGIHLIDNHTLLAML